MYKQLKYLMLTNSFFQLSINMFAPFFAIYVEKIQGTVFDVGTIWSVYILSLGLLSLIVTRFENHKEYADYFLIAGFILRMAGWVAYIYATSLLHIYLIQLVMALGDAFGTNAYNFIFSRFLSRKEVAYDYGVNLAISSFIVGTASLIGGIVVENFGFNTLFIVMILVSIVSVALGLRYSRILDK